MFSKSLRLYYPVVLSVVIGVAISSYVFLYARQTENLEANQRLVEKSDNFEREFREHLRHYETLLRGADAFYSSSNNVSADEFKVFSSRLITNTPEALSLQFVLKVLPANLPVYRQEKLLSGGPADLRQYRGQEMIALQDQASPYYVLHYIWNNESEEITPGLDLASLPSMNDVFKAVEQMHTPIISAPQTAFEELGKDAVKDDVYIALPIEGLTETDKKYSEKAFMVLGVDLRIALSKFSQSIFKDEISARVSVNDNGKDVFLYSSNQDVNFQSIKSSRLDIMGQNFHFDYAYKKTGASLLRWHSFSLLLGGLLLTLFMSAYIYLWRKQQKKDRAAREALSLEIIEKEILFKQVKATQEDSNRQKTFLKTVLDNMPLAVFAKDVKNSYTYGMLNKTAEKIFQIRESEAIGKSDYDYFPKAEADFFRSTDEKVMAEGQVVEIDAEPVTTKDGTFTAHTIKVPVYDEDGNASLLVGILEDVTERIKFLEELRIAKEHAELASNAKSDFLANMSHELRTPLNSILGMNRLLLESKLEPEQRELLDAVFRSSVNLLDIVNDILDLSKIESGEMELEKIGFDITYSFYSVIHTLEHLAREKNIVLTKNYDRESFPYVLGDPLRMNGILTNLINNGIKYTDHGSVHFSASYKPLKDGYIEVRCEITDTGIGIPHDKQERIFEKFGQADTSTTRKYGGTGLGLAITKQLVDIMGGEIGVISEVGEGSTFWITIPFQIAKELSPDSRISKSRVLVGTIPAGQARILVAEDHLANQLLVKKILKKFGIVHFEIVENGLLAIEKYKEENWDILLLDCHMPELNGYDTTLQIRELEKNSEKRLPIVAMTANAMVGEREKCLRYGMDDYISKPINIDELKDILNQWLFFENIKPAETEFQEQADESPVDLAQLRTFTESEEEEKEFIEVFVLQSDINYKVLEENRQGQDAKAWSEAAHMMKGGAGGLGALRLQKLCDQAQHFEGTAAEREKLFKAISDEYLTIKQYLRKIGLLP